MHAGCNWSRMPILDGRSSTLKELDNLAATPASNYSAPTVQRAKPAALPTSKGLPLQLDCNYGRCCSEQHPRGRWRPDHLAVSVAPSNTSRPSGCRAKKSAWDRRSLVGLRAPIVRTSSSEHAPTQPSPEASRACRTSPSCAPFDRGSSPPCHPVRQLPTLYPNQRRLPAHRRAN